MKSRITVKFAGISGLGISSVGESALKALKDLGYHCFGYREYPSLIKGGVASYQIDLAPYSLNGSTRDCDILLCMDRACFYNYLPTVAQNGKIVHAVTELSLTGEQKAFIKERNIKIEYVNVWQLAIQSGGKPIMANIVMLGILWKLLSLDIQSVMDDIEEQFSSKKDLIKPNQLCAQSGFDHPLSKISSSPLKFKKQPELSSAYAITGNDAIAIGAIAAGVRAFFAYPMTPSSSILTYLAKTYKQSGMVIKQAEDEITAAQMTLGAMHMGTRALTATSGGGFDLMTESLSMAAITEIPFVCILAQRPGPATGLPTWTSAADLNLALYAGHGEFPRIVLAASDPASGYHLIQHSFNLSEKYQVPVILLTEKQIAESHYLLSAFPDPLNIERNLSVPSEDDSRYQSSKNGVSKRWAPGTSDTTFNANSDEHDQNGNSIEDSFNTIEQTEKRMRKLKFIAQELPEPKVYGDRNPHISFIGWGSVKGAILDFINHLKQLKSSTRIAYLHYEYLYPFKQDQLKKYIKSAKNVILVENNFSGQLGDLIVKEAGIKIERKLLKYDGRPLFLEDLIEYIEKLKL